MGGANTRWIVGAGALLVAALAFYLLLHGGPREVMHGETREAEARKLREAEASQPALDEIDARSRAAMRDLLREAGEE